MNDKKLLILVMAVLIVFEYRFIYSPGKRKLGGLNLAISQKESDSRLLDKLCKEYQDKQLKEKDEMLLTSGPEFSLFAYLGSLIEKGKMEKNVTGIKPLPIIEKESFLVEKIGISMDNITLQQLYNFLYGLEKGSNPVYVPEFRMRRNREKQFLLSAEMELLSIKKAGER